MNQQEAPSGVTSNSPDAPTSQPAPDTRPPEEQPQEESGQAEPGHFDPETGNLTSPETTEPLDDDGND
jgi:hypothetical protein